jgi:hypothetical protein
MMVKARPALYLSGSIEHQKNHKVWRNQIYKALHRNFKVIIPDKAISPFEKTDVEFKEWMRDNFVMKDMINVATSQYFFVKIDNAVLKGAGTISEITTASWLGKHMVYILDGVKEQSLPSWMLGCLAIAEQVNSIEEAIEVYKEIAKERKKEQQEKDQNGHKLPDSTPLK